MLFAETSNEQTTGLMLFAALLGTAITWLWNTYTKSKADDRMEKKEEEKGVIDNLRSLIERQDNALNAKIASEAQLREEIRKLWEEIHKVELREAKTTTSLKAHLEYLEGILRDSGISFRKYSDALLDKDAVNPKSGGQP